jgi:hypothetical protein
MTDGPGGWVTFEGAVEAMPWGDAVYTVLPLPPDAVAALGRTRRVEGEIAEHPVNLAISRAPVIEGAFLWTGRSLLDRIGIAPGEPVEVRLRPAPDDAVDTPEDLAAALRAAGLTAAWESLTAGRRRGLMYGIDTARRAETRARRLAALVTALAAGELPVRPGRGTGT